MDAGKDAGVTAAELAACVGKGWQPGIGDPGLAGWMTVASYAASTVLALLVARRRPRAGRLFWAVLAALLAALAVNKQLDLQTALTQVGRCLALEQGWYEDRARVQLALIAGLAGLSLGAVALAAWMLRGRARANAAALAGLALLLGFVLVRAVGFHQVDWLISVPLPGANANFALENAGLVLIAANALRHLTRARMRARRNRRA